MTRFTAVAVLGLALVVSACQESAVGPGPGGPHPNPTETVSVKLVGIVAMSDDAAPKLGLRQGDVFTYLAGNIRDLENHLGKSVGVVGEFDAAGVFQVVSYSFSETDGGREMSRAP